MQNLEPLLIFITVADMGSFTHAADSLGIQKGRASTAVRKLEEDVGVRLLHRTAYFAQGRPSIHDKPVHGFAPCRSTAREAERVGLSINDDHSSMSGFFDLEQSTDRL
jgi:Bacterial regulatory helix-turn-helix protein, lysR family